MHPWLYEAKAGLTSVKRHIGSHFLALFMLGIGFAAVCAVGEAAYRILWSPLPYRDGQELVEIRISLDGSASQPELSGHEIDHLVRNSRTLREIAGVWLRRTSLGAAPEQDPATAVISAADVRLGIITANLFDLLGAPMARGRRVRSSDGLESSPPVVVLSHRLWEARFGADPDVLNSLVAVNGLPMRVVGVLDPGFKLLLPSAPDAAQVDLWIPNREELSREFSHRFSALARLRTATQPPQAQRELNQLRQGLDLSNAAYGSLPPRFQVRGLSQALAGPYRLPLALLGGAAAGLLLLISFNLAAQHLSQIQHIEREAAVRLALGASRLRLALASGIRTILLMIPSALLGLLLSWWLLEALRVAAASLPWRTASFAPGLEALLVMLAAALLSGMGYLLPLWTRLSRLRVAEGLRASSSRLFGGSRRLRHLLVTGQIAGCMALLVGALWLTQSFDRLLSSHPGFASRGVMTFAASLPGRVYHSPELRAQYARRMSGRLQAIPGVEAAGAVSELPLSGTARRGVYAFQGEAGQDLADFRYVVPGYFQAMGIQLLRGRLFQSTDLEDNLPVTVIDAALARQGWPQGDPIGERILLPTSDGDASWRTVIGVVENVRQDHLAQLDSRQVYLTMSDRSVSRMFFVLRTPSLAATDWDQVIRQAVSEVDHRVGVAQIRSMDDWVRSSLSQTRFLGLLLSTFSAAGLLLAAMALYAALSSLTAERRGEIGLRMAVGARPADILRWIAAQALGLLAVGVSTGLVVALLGWELFAPLLYTGGVFQGWPLLYACAALALVAFCAVFLPALRAGRTDPSAALRSM